jgi:large subunit ribosomal protein L24
MKLHTGDTVVIISGKDKGKTGTIMRVLTEVDQVVVGGVNMRTRHIKKTYQQAGRILKYEASIAACKVMLLDPKTKKPTRIGYKTVDGKKIRIAKLSGEEVKKVRAPKQAKKAAAAPSPAKAAEGKEKAKEAPEQQAPQGGKQPFWKRLQFGSAVEGSAGEGHQPQESPIPSQAMTKRSTGRGS